MESDPSEAADAELHAAYPPASSEHDQDDGSGSIVDGICLEGLCGHLEIVTRHSKRQNISSSRGVLVVVWSTERRFGEKETDGCNGGARRTNY